MQTGISTAREHFWLSCLLAWIFLPTAIVEAQTNVGGAKQVQFNEAEQAWLGAHPVIYWGVDPRRPPFSTFDQRGRGSGIDIETLDLMAKRAGLNLKLVQTRTWPETLQKLSAGEIDFVAGIARTEERERVKGLLFTRAYSTFPTAIITRKDMPFLTSMEILKSERIALPHDYVITEEVRRMHPGAHLVMTDADEQSMLMVAGNKADVTALNLATANYVVHMRGLSNLKISGFTDLEFFLSLAVRRDSPELHSILDKSLATIDKKEQEAIYAKYILLETRKAIDWKVWRRRAINFIFIGSGALLVVLLWNRTLAREIRRRKAVETALRKVGDELLSANNDLQSFSSSVSHDLKSPLRRLHGFVDLLRKEAGQSLNEDHRHYLTIIDREALRMSELITALLAFARVGRAELRPAPLNLSQLVHEVVREAQVETNGREIIWKIDELPEATCDPGLMRQVFANLIDNAVKFTRGRAPARIEVSVLPVKPEDQEVVFYVHDNGSGFDMKLAGTLFQPFQRLHRKEEFEGTGLGLTTIQRIIQKHGGRVWAEAEVNKGATFYFSLPLNIVQAHSQSPTPS